MIPKNLFVKLKRGETFKFSNGIKTIEISWCEFDDVFVIWVLEPSIDDEQFTFKNFPLFMAGLDSFISEYELKIKY